MKNWKNEIKKLIEPDKETFLVCRKKLKKSFISAEFDCIASLSRNLFQNIFKALFSILLLMRINFYSFPNKAPFHHFFSFQIENSHLS